MTEMATYTDEQKEELTKLFAGILYDTMREIRPAKIEKLTERLFAEARKRSWFRYDKNKYGVLRHLEEAGVYGVFDFFSEGRTTLYLRAVFPASFQTYAKQAGLSKEKFVENLASPKSRARKPTQAEMLGDTSASGNKRMNMRGRPLSSR